MQMRFAQQLFKGLLFLSYFISLLPSFFFRSLLYIFFKHLLPFLGSQEKIPGKEKLLFLIQKNSCKKMYNTNNMMIQTYLESKTILCNSFSQVLNAETCFSANISLKSDILVSSGIIALSLAALTSASMAASFPISIFFAL